MKRLLSSLFVFLLMASLAVASTVIIQLTAENPDDQTRAVAVRSILPTGIRKDDILRTSGLSVDYDVKLAAYYAHADLTLAAGESRMLVVELRDIWIIPETDLDELQVHIGELMLLFRSSERRKEGAGLADRIRTSLHGIRERQIAHALPDATVEAHVQAFIENQLYYAAMREQVSALEELVLADGQDPGKLLGVHAMGPQAEAPSAPPTPGQARLVVTVDNPSPTETQMLDIRHYLPREITAQDVVDPGSLAVRTDLEDGLAYLFKADVVIPPQESVAFGVLLMDRWNINSNRIARLEQEAREEFTAVKKWIKYRSVERRLGEALLSLRTLKAAQPPGTVNEAYVAFFRDQAKALDDIEQDIRWVRMMKRNGLVGPPFGPPTRKAVWMIIWIILGFLAVVTLLVLLHSQKSRYT